MESLRNFGFFIFALATSILLGGYVFMQLWEWFIVYAFDVKSIGYMQSIGVVFFWNYLTLKKEENKDIDPDSIAESLVRAISIYIITLILGHLIILFQ